MSDSQQALLRSAWLDAKDGPLSGREQAKAWAMREIWKGDGKPKHGMLMYIAAKLKKKGGGSPSCPALHQLFAKVDADDDWFPGKANYDDVGRLPVMTRQQRAALASCAMAMKKNGIEPTYGKVVAACPKAALNPKTKRPFSKHSVYRILEEDCYDDDPCLPWVNKARYSKKALTPEMMERRLKFADYVEGLHRVGDVQVLKRKRETLQGRPKPIKGGRSATMVYSYTYTLCRRGVVASFDLSARNLHLFKTDHWLKDPRNVIQLHLTSPAWQTGVAASSQMMSRTEQMRSWTVAETGRFLEEHDLEGPAVLTRVSGVNGADLLQLSINELSHDIRLTPFAARKVGAARDEFLRGL